jgi:hypothetical protein
MCLAGLDRAHHHLTRIHSDPCLQRQPAFLPHAVRMAFQLFLQPDCAVQGPLRMVLMGYRRAEQREDAVPVDCTT